MVLFKWMKSFTCFCTFFFPIAWSFFSFQKLAPEDQCNIKISNDISWGQLFGGRLSSEKWSSQAIIYLETEVKKSFAVKVYGSSVIDLETGGRSFALHSLNGKKIPFYLYSLRNPQNLDQLQTTLIEPGDIILHLMDGNNNTSNAFYGVIPSNTLLQSGVYSCHLIFKAYLGS